MKTYVWEKPAPIVKEAAQKSEERESGGLVPVPYYFLIGGGVGLCLALGLGIWLVRLMVWWSALGWALSIGLFVGSALGGLLSLWGIGREWVYEGFVFYRRWKWEQEDRKRAAKGEDVVKVELATGSHMDYTCRVILERVYLEGFSGGRDVCKEQGICSPTEWDFLNGIRLALGLREGYRFKVMGYVDALAIWRSAVSVDPVGMFGEDDLGGLRVNGRRWGAVDDKMKQQNKKARKK